MTLALEGGEWSAARPGRTLPPEKTQYPLYRRLSGPQGRSGQAENLAPTGIQSPDRPARSQSLYRLSYPAHALSYRPNKIIYYNILYSNFMFRVMRSKVSEDKYKLLCIKILWKWILLFSEFRKYYGNIRYRPRVRNDLYETWWY
jgi:hypothetical protein